MSQRHFIINTRRDRKNMNTEHIERELELLGNAHSMFSNMRLYSVLTIDSFNDYLCITLAFPLVSTNSAVDQPISSIVCHYTQIFESVTDNDIIKIVNEYAIRYANTYIRPLAGLMEKLNTGKNFDKPARNGDR